MIRELRSPEALRCSRRSSRCPWGACNSNVELYLGDTLIAANELLPKIKAIRETRSDAESVVYLRGDKDVCYTDMMKLLGYIRTAGFKANIVIVPEQGS